MGYSTVDCKARSWLWLARKHCENSAFEFFDQTPFSGYHERSGLGRAMALRCLGEPRAHQLRDDDRNVELPEHRCQWWSIW